MNKAIALFACVLCCATLSAADPVRPYVLATAIDGSLTEVEQEVRVRLDGAGFEVVGDYSPYEGALVVVVTHPELLEASSGPDMGGFAAVLRVGITDNEGTIEVSYTNPTWVAGICRLNSELGAVSQAMEEALGYEKAFGSKKGKEPKRLRKYHYMAFMPHFDDPVLLAEHSTHEDAVAAVETGLTAGRAGAAKVYRVDIPGKEEVLFGVSLAEGEGSDENVMAVTDVGEPKHTAHLPYELLVSGSNVYTLHGKFRIAQSFPDLGMGTFMKISGAPKNIHQNLAAVAQ